MSFVRRLSIRIDRHYVPARNHVIRYLCIKVDENFVYMFERVEQWVRNGKPNKGGHDTGRRK